MKEIMNAIRLKDNKSVKVERDTKIQWIDCQTKEKYILHIDIELLY